MAQATVPLLSVIDGSQFKDLPFFMKESFLQLTKPAYGKITDKAAIDTLCGSDEIPRSIDIVKSVGVVGGENWSVLKGYPKSPMVIRLAACLLVWMDRGSADICLPTTCLRCIC